MKKNSQSFDSVTLVGSLKSGKSRESTAPKPSAIQTTIPSNKKHQEYLTRNVEYLNETNGERYSENRSLTVE